MTIRTTRAQEFARRTVREDILNRIEEQKRRIDYLIEHGFQRGTPTIQHEIDIMNELYNLLEEVLAQ